MFRLGAEDTWFIQLCVYTFVVLSTLISTGECSPTGSSVRAEGTWTLGCQHSGPGPTVPGRPAHRRSWRTTQEPAAKDRYVGLDRIITSLHHHQGSPQRSRPQWRHGRLWSDHSTSLSSEIQTCTAVCRRSQTTNSNSITLCSVL